MSAIRPQYILRALLVLLVGAFIYAILQPAGTGPLVGEAAPDFELGDLDGKTMRLQDYRGKIVVVNFWATWCPPCVEEMPSLNRFQATFAPRGVVVLAISVDDDERALRQFAQQHRLNMTILRDPGRKISTRYQTFKYPETYILDRQGRLAQKLIGPADWTSTSLVSFFEQLLSKS